MTASFTLAAPPRIEEAEFDRYVDEHGVIHIIWSVEDVLEVRPDLSREQACHVLKEVKRRHDAVDGVNWASIEWTADDLYPAPDETGGQP